MKKLLTMTAFICCAAFAFAQGTNAHFTVNDDMRLYEKEGEEAIHNFPSKYLSADSKIAILLPEGYDNSSKSYPSVYLISNKRMGAETVAQLKNGKKSISAGAFIIMVTVSGVDTSANLANFIARELLPYFEMNYRIDSRPESRTLVSHGTISANVLEALAANGGYFKNAAVLITETMPLPSMTGIDKDVRIWAAGNISNMSRLQSALEENGLKYPANFAYKIYSQTDPDVINWGELNFNYIFNKESSSLAKSKVKVYQSASKIALGDFAPIKMWLNMKTKGGYVINYIPRDLKIAPPYFNWDADNASLTPIYGADSDTVKISAVLPFGKTFETSVKITK